MSRYAIYKAADERGVSHRTAMFLWDYTDDPDEFLAMLDEVAAGRGFALID